ncbi:MAG: hypothetical protein IKI57_02485 [Clostridia bacterium]|nr:hypothetical protein [Clostridia bacterium]
MVKRILMSVLVLSIVVTLCACGNSNNNNGDKNPDEIAYEHLKEADKETDSFKDKTVVSDLNKVVQSSVKTPANAGEWIELQTSGWNKDFDVVTGNVKLRVSEIYNLADSRALLNKLYENEEKMNKEINNRLTAEEKAEFGDISLNIWEEIYKSKDDIKAVKLTFDFKDFKESELYLSNVDLMADVIDTYGEPFMDISNDFVYFSNYLVDESKPINKNEKVEAYAIFCLPKNLDEDFMIEFQKSLDFNDERYEYIIIDANNDSNAQSSKNVASNDESFASKAKASSLNKPLNLGEVGSFDTYKGKMHSIVDFVSTEVDKEDNYRLDKFNIKVDTKDVDNIREGYDTYDFEPRIYVYSQDGKKLDVFADVEAKESNRVMAGAIVDVDLELEFEDENTKVEKYIIEVTYYEDETLVNQEKQYVFVDVSEEIEKLEKSIEESKLKFTAKGKTSSLTSPAKLGEEVRFEFELGEIDVKLEELERINNNSRYFRITFDVSKMSLEEKYAIVENLHFGRELYDKNGNAINKGFSSVTLYFFDKDGKSIKTTQEAFEKDPDSIIKIVAYYRNDFSLTNGFEVDNCEDEYIIALGSNGYDKKAFFKVPAISISTSTVKASNTTSSTTSNSTSNNLISNNSNSSTANQKVEEANQKVSEALNEIQELRKKQEELLNSMKK